MIFNRFGRIVVFAAVPCLLAGSIFGYRAVSIGTAYKAKILCSGVWVSKRDPQAVMDAELAVDDLGVLRLIRSRIDRDAKLVSASLFGIATRTAVFRQGQGCALALSDPAQVPRERSPLAGLSSRPEMRQAATFAEPSSSDLHLQRLGAIVDGAFMEDDPNRLRRTRAVLIIHRGRLVAERYAPGFSRDTPLPGWSMAKSVMNALVGILVKQGKIALHDPVPVAQWHSSGDPRRAITMEHLLHMSSGLQFDESYRNPLSDVMVMLLASPDAAAIAIARPLASDPGTQWHYSSGTTNIIARVIRNIVGDQQYPDFPRQALFERIGMSSATMETDSMGTFVGSSFMYATARDWARLGMLYQQDGMWNGERILPEGWVAYSRTPAPHSPGGQYGAHFWLRYPPELQCKVKSPPFPDDAFHAIGHEGQHLTVVPSRELVIVRLGLTRQPCNWDHHAFVGAILRALD